MMNRIQIQTGAMALLLSVFCSQATAQFATQSPNRFENDSNRWLFANPEFEERDGERDRIETERHDFTQSTTTVGKGVTQFEFGYSFFHKSERGEDENSHTTPELMVRYGLTDKLEIRLRYNEVWQFGEEDFSGSEDLRWAFKIRTSEQAGWMPESGLEIRSTLPTGGSDWSTDDLE